MFLADDLADVGDILLRGHEVGQVIAFQFIVTTWDDRLALAFDGHHMVRIIGTAEVFQRLVEYLARLPQLDAKHHQCSVVHIPALTDPRHAQSVDDVTCREHLRIDELVNAQLLVELLNVGLHILAVVDLCHRLAGVKGMGENTAVDILVVVGCHGDKQVRVTGIGLFECLYARWRAVEGQQVIVAAYTGQSVLVVIDHGDLFLIAGEQPCQIGTNGVCAGNDDLHKSISNFLLSSS